MKNTELNPLQIRILLRCIDDPLSKTNLTRLCQNYARQHGKDWCQESIENLINQEFLISKEMPKPGATKTPILYFLTNKGKAWITHYKENYPKI